MARILVIDDHDEFRRMMKRMLTQAGHEVLDAADGEKGIDCYQQNQIDLVITDIFMPEKEGIETVVELRSINPKIKIIAVSGGGTRRDLNYLHEIRDFGVQKSFEKPFQNDEILAAIDELLADA